MKKKYNIFIISRLYLKSFYNFLITETDIRSTKEAYSLFIYSVKKLYDLDTVEYSSAINEYGSACVEYLNNTPNTPVNKKKVPYEDKVRIVSVCEGYAQVTGLLTYRAINDGRVIRRESNE